MLLLNELEPFSEWVSNIGHGGRGTERSRKREARDRSREREREKERPSWPADRTKAKKEREDRWRRPWKEETKRSYLTRFTFTAIDSYFFFALPLSFLIHVLFFSEFDIVRLENLRFDVEVTWNFAINLEIGYIYYINRTNVATVSKFALWIFNSIPSFSSPLPSLLRVRKNIISKRRSEMEVSSLNILRLFYRFK